MWNYLKHAFWLSPRVPLLGALPLNPVMVACFFILGFGSPGFWLLGLGVETAYLFGLATNARFRRLVDAMQALEAQPDAEIKRQALVTSLDPDTQRRLAMMRQKCDRVVQLYNDVQSDAFSAESNREALQRLQWTYLKLLVARTTLRSGNSREVEQQVSNQISMLKKDVADEKLSPALRDSKAATLELLEKRAEMLKRKEQSLAEVESDLVRIEAQVDLAMEKATIPGQPEHISTDIALASQLLDDDLYGDSVRAVNDLEAAYKQSA